MVDEMSTDNFRAMLVATLRRMTAEWASLVDRMESTASETIEDISGQRNLRRLISHALVEVSAEISRLSQVRPLNAHGGEER